MIKQIKHLDLFDFQKIIELGGTYDTIHTLHARTRDVSYVYTPSCISLNTVYMDVYEPYTL